MLSPFINSNTNKRYYTLDYYFKQKYGFKVGRIPINAGFTCPNIDGTKSYDGCTFCSIKGSGDFAGHHTDSLLKQWDDGKNMMLKKWPNAKFIAYFQAFTNTYAPLEVLRKKYEVFVDLEECIGISIATRPDCLDDNIIDYLGELNQRCNLIVELGLQTIHEETGLLINRCHTTKELDVVVKKLQVYNINVVIHIINGLPKETTKMMLQTAKYVSDLKVDGIKIHLLHIVNGTHIVKQLNQGLLEMMQQDDYVNLVCDQLEVISPNIVIHRLTGDAPQHEFIGPIWSRKKGLVLNKIDQELVRRDSWQGKKFKKNNH